MPEPHKNELWKVLLSFFIHTFVGSAIFMLIALAAICLEFGIEWAKDMDVSNFIVTPLVCAKYSVFAVDLALFGQFIVLVGIKTAKELWQLLR